VSRAGGRAFLYHFSKVRPGTFGERFGAFHGAEVPFVFGTFKPRDLPGLGTLDVDARDRALSEEMASAWVRFASTGDPNGGALARWPPHDAAPNATLAFGATTALRDNPCAATCDLFDDIARDWRARRVTTPGTPR
jgi:para-nitrobenzyl esterase